MKLNMDWQAIHPLGGSKADAFEELCAQLARATKPVGSTFVRKGTPDGGVECYAALPDGSEWGWQAKYFSSQADSQWAQIDESVATALEKHPALVKYVVCVPIDLADARVSKQKSAKQRWDERVVKWRAWASQRAMSVEFEWMGSHEMLVLLAQPKNISLANFFFGTTMLDAGWFEQRLNEAVEAAGPRYSPALNVRLELTQELEAFAREESLHARVLGSAAEMRKVFRGLTRLDVAETLPKLKGFASSLEAACDRVFSEYAAVRYEPSAPRVFDTLEEALKSSVVAAQDAIEELSRAPAASDEAAAAGDVGTVGTASAAGARGVASSKQDWKKDFRYQLSVRHRTLLDALGLVSALRELTNSKLLILNGQAGSGKTHLLCDLAKRRTAAKKPTVVLMGQRFLTGTDPWMQVLQQLGETGWSVHDLVGALEVAAQIADARTLLIIDAVNEGNGLRLWPANMAAFLARVQASEWISVVLSVRSTYEEVVVPQEVRERATRLEHRGFSNVEFDAMSAFFEFYQIELPSSPLLVAEFQNPLFLKTLCSGLRDMGERRLPRGASGISNTFKFYLTGVNHRLSDQLDYAKRSNLVERAVHSLAKIMATERKHWLDLTAAEGIVDALLPGRAHSNSLFANLLREGVLLEERIWVSNGDPIAVVLIGYERLADYVIAGTLLDEHLIEADPARAFAADGALNFLAKSSSWPTPGIHEALHVLVSERTGGELADLAPGILKAWQTPSAFRQSVIWRDTSAVTARTGALLLSIGAEGGYPQSTIETLLTVATLPTHPLNADYLDAHLRAMTMPERDEWWSTSLHHMWGNKAAVDRLVRWAGLVWPHTVLDAYTARLGAITLSWFLSTSNRFLRDQACKGLLRLITGRPALCRELVQKFFDVDDAYVAERVLGAVYGALMRSTDKTGVAEVATTTHDLVFASGRPRPHVLFREYARGIIKRAAYLCEGKGVKLSGIDPPYDSTWPGIPSLEEVDAIAPNWSAGTKDGFSWAHRHIRSSVMDDDFGRYVIGTNSGTTNFLSLRLDEPMWCSLEGRVDEAVAALSPSQAEAWNTFDDARSQISAREAMARFNIRVGGALADAIRKGNPRGKSATERDLAPVDSPAELTAKKERFLSLLNAIERAAFTDLIALMSKGPSMNHAPKFNLKIVQRYVVARVFQLGWTSKRFASFDEESVDRSGRGAAKAERIGKKYQWIAYHEMCALLADHYQYVDPAQRNGPAGVFKGSWPDNVRDLDVSNTMVKRGESDEESGTTPPFWGASGFDSWGGNLTPKQWARDLSDVPSIERLLLVSDPETCSDWLNLAGYFKWTRPADVYEVNAEPQRRELWIACDALFIKREDVNAARSQAVVRAAKANYHAPSGNYEIFLGELSWSEASEYFQQPYYGDSGWSPIERGIGLKAAPTTFKYLRESGNFDCSVRETFSLSLPHPALLRGLSASWSGISATYVDGAGRVVAFDPTANVDGPSALLVRRDALDKYLDEQQLAICWLVRGEKRAAEGAPKYSTLGERDFAAVFTYANGRLEGALEVEDASKLRKPATAKARTKANNHTR